MDAISSRHIRPLLLAMFCLEFTVMVSNARVNASSNMVALSARSPNEAESCMTFIN